MTASEEKELVEVSRWEAVIAMLAILAIGAHLILRYGYESDSFSYNLPLYIALAFGGGPLVFVLLRKLLRKQFGSDLLAGISIVTSIVLQEYLAGTLVVLMLSGGEALEAYAVKSASSVLEALAKRMPSFAHKKIGSRVKDVSLEEVAVGDHLIVYPHEVCPVDGTVLEGHGVMDESYLTGEPYMLSKGPGANVISGSINGESALTIVADKLAVDSRYAKIMEVMRASQQERPQMRRLGDQLGAIYTPIAVAIAIIAWYLSGDATRFLAVLVVATPCPLLIAIPVAIIGSISLAAKRAIIVRDPLALETANTCRTVIFDKTGTLTYGSPKLTDETISEGFDADEALALVSTLERYSRHPLANAVIEQAKERKVATFEAQEVSEKPGQGLSGKVRGRVVRITSRKQLLIEQPDAEQLLPAQEAGMECVVMIDGSFAALYRFRDVPRKEGKSFISHLGPKHAFSKIMLVSGDRESEVSYMANQVGISDVHANKSPEEKVEIVKRETQAQRTIFVGDGINDAPALSVATVGIAFGQNSDITTEAADVVIMDSSLAKVDEFLHISARMRKLALQSAVGGMILSIGGMFLAAAGFLSPVGGALAQEAIDVVAIANALRVAFPPSGLTDFR